MNRKTRSLALLLTAVLCLGMLAGCVAPAAPGEQSPAPEPPVTPGQTDGISGTFDGEGQGNNGPVKVKVTLEDGRIAAVDVVEHVETAGVCELAIGNTPKDIVAYNLSN